MKKSRLTRLSVITVAVALSSCSLLSTKPDLGSINGTNIVYPKAPTPAFIGVSPACYFTNTQGLEAGEDAGVIGGILLSVGNAVIPAASSYIFDSLIRRANQATLQKTASTTAVSNEGDKDTLYQIDDDFGEVEFAKCILIARAPQSNLPSSYVKKFNDEMRWSENKRADLNKALPGLNLKGDEIPELLVELTIETIKSQTKGEDPSSAGFRVRPTVIAFGATGAKKTSDDNSKDVLIALTLDGFLPENGKGLKQQTIYSHDYVFEGLPIGTVEKYEYPITGVPAPEIVSRALVGKAGPIVAMPSGTYKVGNSIRRLEVPLKLTAVITEVEEGGDLARALIAAVAEKKSEITEPLDTLLKDILKDALPSVEEEATEGES